MKLAAALVTVACAFSALAGPLDPPVGPITSTQKPLAEVEPRTAINAANTPGDADSLFKITAPGSYYLTGNVTGVSAKHGVEIAASGVSLDLMGFRLQGVAGSLDGVNLSVGASNIVVVNGAASGWGGDGFDLNFAGNALLDRLAASTNGAVGLRMGSGNIRDCAAAQNIGSGILTGSRCTITRCSSSANGTGASAGHGISTGSECTISGCTTGGNGAGAGGGNGIVTGNTCLVLGCASNSNGNAASSNNDGGS